MLKPRVVIHCQTPRLPDYHPHPTPSRCTPTQLNCTPPFAARAPAGLFRSRIVSGLRVPLLLIAAESTLVCAYEAARNAQLLPAAFRSIQIRAPMLFS